MRGSGTQRRQDGGSAPRRQPVQAEPAAPAVGGEGAHHAVAGSQPLHSRACTHSAGQGWQGGASQQVRDSLWCTLAGTAAARPPVQC